jgi:hypothetical protein
LALAFTAMNGRCFESRATSSLPKAVCTAFGFFKDNNFLDLAFYKLVMKLVYLIMRLEV